MFELFLDNGCRIKVERGGTVRAEGYIFLGVRCGVRDR